MRHAAKNRWFSVQNHLFFIPFFTHKELCELPMKSAFRQNAEAQKFVQQKTTLAAAGQRLYNQTKNRKEGFQVKIQIIQKQCGGTEFLAQPHRLHGPGAPLRSTCAAVTAPCWHRSHWTRSTASPWTAA